MDQRKCKTCGETKPEDLFSPFDIERGYRSRECIECETARRQARAKVDRTCKTCRIVKPIEEFNIAQGREGWRRHECKPCESARKKNWYADNLERVRKHQRDNPSYVPASKKPEAARLKWNAQMKSYRDKAKLECFAAYGGMKCGCCGESQSMFLSLDHIDNDAYLRRKLKVEPSGGPRLYGRLRKLGFPKGFQVLCMNCNFGKARNKGVCPHQEGSTTSRKA